MESQVNWLTLTDLGRRFGLSAVSCGRMLSTAGMRDDDGLPSDVCLLYTSPSPRDYAASRMPSSA